MTTKTASLGVVQRVEDGLRSLAENGFCVHENAVTADQLTVLRQRFEEQAELEVENNVGLYESSLGVWHSQDNGAEKTPIQVVEHLVNKGRVFLDTAKSHLFQEYLRGLLPRGRVNLAAMFGFVVKRGTPAQPIHVDQAAIAFETPVPVGAHFLLCLSDFTEDMGATRLIPGSHLEPLPRIDFDPQTGTLRSGGPVRESIPAVAKAGSLIIYDARLHHGRGASTSDNTRYSLSFGFNYEWRAQFSNFAAILHDEVYKTLDSTDLALLGFGGNENRVGPRFPGDFRGGDIAYVPELRRDGDGVVVAPVRSLPVASL